MLLGHYAVALAGKKYAPRTNLGTLVAAATLLDLLWPVFLVLGWETVRISPGDTVVTPLDFVSYPWSHSLFMSIVWGMIFGGLYFAVRHDRRGAAVLGLLVVSHWLLDLIVHRPDLPLTPWTQIKFGFGLWNSVAASAAIELGLLAAGALVYARVTHARNRVGSWGLAIFLALLALLYVASLIGPPPPSVDAIIYADTGAMLFLAFAAWIDANRSI